MALWVIRQKKQRRAGGVSLDVNYTSSPNDPVVRRRIFFVLTCLPYFEYLWQQKKKVADLKTSFYSYQ
jgi:hypothetical protein